jgi:hypothetical protein
VAKAAGRARTAAEYDAPDEYDEGDNDAPKRGRPSNKAKLAKFHEEVRTEFSEVTSVCKPVRLACLSDRRFAHVPGSQWDGFLEKQFENRPRYEINKTAIALDQIETDFRDNRIDASFVSKDGALDKDLADTCDALYRTDMKDSNAQRAILTAFQEGVAGGMGAWRLTTVREDPFDAEDDAPKRIALREISDADRFVFHDLDAREPDKSDARRCWVLCPMTHAEFERKYPDRGSASTWPNEVHQGEFDWATEDTVYVAEVFDVEWDEDMEVSYGPPRPMLSLVGAAGASRALPQPKEKPGLFKVLWQSDIDDEPALESDLLDMGYKKLRERKRKRKFVHKYLMDGLGIIKDYGYIEGTEIPVVVYYAKRALIDNVERIWGHIRLARDPQQIKNMLISKLAEFTAVASPEIPILDPEQINNHRTTWASNNLTPNPYLPLDKLTNADGHKEAAGPQGWTKNSNVPPALSALHEQADADMKEILSTPDPGGKVVSHVSGKVMQAVQRQVDAKSAPYIHSMADALRWSAKIWLGMAPEVYHQPGRRMRGLGPQGEESSITLHDDALDDDGDLETKNDLSRAKFDVTAEVGPSSDSEEEAAIETCISVLGVTDDPQTKLIMTLTLLSTMQKRVTKPIQKWARRKLLEMGVGDPTPEEAKAIEAAKQQAQPSPMDNLANAQAKAEEAKAGNADANRALTLARTEKTRVEALKIVADAHLQHATAQVDAAKTAHDMSMAEVSAATPGESGSGSDGSGSLGSAP